MRRSDREVTDVKDIQNMIDKCEVVRIAINDDTYPYIIPVNFGYEFNGGRLTLFFHSSTEGYKHKVIEKNNHASFEMDCSLTLMPPINGTVCTASMAYESVIGQGEILTVDDSEKENVLEKILEHYNIHGGKFNPVSLQNTKVYKIEVQSFTAKRRKNER